MHFDRWGLLREIISFNHIFVSYAGIHIFITPIVLCRNLNAISSILPFSNKSIQKSSVCRQGLYILVWLCYKFVLDIYYWLPQYTTDGYVLNSTLGRFRKYNGKRELWIWFCSRNSHKNSFRYKTANKNANKTATLNKRLNTTKEIVQRTLTFPL